MPPTGTESARPQEGAVFARPIVWEWLRATNHCVVPPSRTTSCGESPHTKVTESFDPYHKWLGIPPQDQPPHHYRLLGIELFESDPDVISNAVDGRMAQIKSFQTGRYSAISQRLLNELALAKVCLLNAQKKPLYDSQLRRQLAERTGFQPSVPVGADLGDGGEEIAVREAGVVAELPRKRDVLPPPVEEDEFVRQLPQLRGTSSLRYCVGGVGGKARRSKSGLVWVTLGVGVAAVLFVIYLLPRQIIHLLPPEEQESRPVEPPTIAKKSPELSHPASLGNTSKKALPPPAVELASSEVKRKSEVPVVPKSDPSQELVLPLELRKPAASASELPLVWPAAEEQPLFPSKQDGAATVPRELRVPATPKKLSVPDALQQQAAEAKVREVFAKELAASQDNDQKLALAARLSGQALATEDAAARFVLWRMACELAAGAGELGEALGQVDKMADGFDVDALGMKADFLAKVVEASRASGWKSAKRDENGTVPLNAKKRSDGGLFQFSSLLTVAMGLADEAVLVDDFDNALRIGKLAAVVARASKDPQMIHDATSRIRDIERLKLRFATIRKSIDALIADSNNVEASLLVGQWYCFTKGDWERGLPLLAKSLRPLAGEGQGEGIAALAARDLDSPTDPKAQAALADAWWDFAEGEQGPSRSMVQGRAALWYEQALPKLSGLDRTRVEARLKMMDEAPGVVDAVKTSRGAVQKGNMALQSNGTQVTGKISHPENLLDGNSTRYDGNGGFAYASLPCEWTITFARTYQLREIRFLLWDGDPNRFYRYAITVSSDGKNFTPLVDRSTGKWKSWQTIDFQPRPIKAIRLYGLYANVYSTFYVVEFEAYCIPPKTPK